MTKLKKFYVGTRNPNDSFDRKVYVEHGGMPFELRHVGNHSEEFEWGYGGSGPADLAWSILADHLGDRATAERWHQAFKSEVIAHLEQSGFRLCDERVDEWCRSQLRKTTAFAVHVEESSSKAVITKGGKPVNPRELSEAEKLEVIAVLLDSVQDLHTDKENLHYELLEQGERD